MSDDRGAVTIWLIGLLLLLVPLGGLGYDLWRAVSERNAVAGIADAAALAGAHAIDSAHARATGEHRLDPDQARQRAYASLTAHTDTIDDATITVADDATSITVYAEREVPLTLLRIVSPHSHHTVASRATSQARRGP